MAVVTRRIQMNSAHIGVFRDGQVQDTGNVILYSGARQRTAESILREARRRFNIPDSDSIVLTETEHVDGMYSMTVEDFMKYAQKVEK